MNSLIHYHKRQHAIQAKRLASIQRQIADAKEAEPKNQREELLCLINAIVAALVLVFAFYVMAATQ